MKDKIIKLRQLGYTYNQIVEELNCSKSVVCYHLGNNQKEKSKNRQIKYRNKNHPYQAKISNFKEKIKYQEKKLKSTINRIIYNKVINFQRGTTMNEIFTLEDVIKKFGDNPKCYLTGKDINIYEPSTYQFDHIIPRSKGGDNSLENLGICTKEANLAKRDMLHEEFIDLCKSILLHNGYKIE